MDHRTNRQTIDIRIWGVVQGVGMRPFVARAAQTHGILGFVRNLGGLVHIRAQGTQDALAAFVAELKANKPLPAVYVRMEQKEVPHERYNGFSILESVDEHSLVILGADLPVCSDCERELGDKANKRYRHPFISCMACGPRYSILDAVPYDRANTAMTVFPLCAPCAHEYGSIADRRFHAQTVSCHDCGPVLLYRDASGQTLEREAALFAAVSALRTGGIVAVKSTGGYHLACDPFDETAVCALRALKRREQKPFALLFHDLDALTPYADFNGQEADLLRSDAKPIVLLRKKPSALAESVFMGSGELGAFLPGTGMQFLLTEACGPLLFTSANVSDSPILTDDEDVFAFFARGLTGALCHTRGIRTGLDDSVLRVADGRVQFIRRSRGFVPLPISLPLPADTQPLAADTQPLAAGDQTTLFAAGSDLKAVFGFSKGDFAYLSQPFGDVDSEDAFAQWTQNQSRLGNLLDIAPKAAVCDLHPGYRTAEFAAAKFAGLPVLPVQHHHAHIASVIAEHALPGKVIGVAFDGTGYGTDGTIWGGEFLLCEGSGFSRVAHLRPTPLLGGDSAMREADKTLLCHLCAAGLDSQWNDPRLSIVRAALSARVNTHVNSSMGRLFDAVCALLGISGENRFEGECGMLLQAAATEAAHRGEQPIPLSFAIEKDQDRLILDPSALLRDLLNLCQTSSIGALALGFHAAVADVVLAVCKHVRETTDTNAVALSGGVFQNTLLLRLCRDALEAEGFSVFQNEAVPPNDGGIALGQLYLGLLKRMEIN